MYEIAICDDDAAFASEFQVLLSDVLEEKDAEYHVSVFEDPEDLLRTIESGKRYDLLFQDVLFDTEKGITFVKRMREQGWGADVVFVTTCMEYAVEGYDAYPMHYLLKPVSRERLTEIMERFLQKHTPQIMCLRTPKGIVQFRVGDILYFEVYNHDIILHKTDGSQMTFRRTTLQEMESSLPMNRFVRSHRSYLVNMEHISEVLRYQIRLSTGETIPISKRLYQNVVHSLIDFDDNTLLNV